MPLKWYGSLVLICLLGVAAIVYSRYERQHPVGGTPPAIGQHWYAALAFDVCGTLAPNLTATPSASAGSLPGIRTDGTGVVQIAPTVSQDAGNNATLARFAQLYPHLKLSSTELQLPGGRLYRNGQSCPSGTPDAGRPATLQIKVWSSFTGPGSQHPVTFRDPAAVKLGDQHLMTVAFVPAGASVPKPSSQTIVALLQARSGTSNPSSQVTVPSTTLPSASVTVPPGSSTVVPQTTAPSRTAPSTTAPSTTVPSTTVPATTSSTAR
jgi:hypothetical protein